MRLSDRIGRRMKLHDLHVLLAVVQAGSMNKAAALLNMTQPNVSKSIAELERTVGVRLLDRNARGVEPTTYGRALLNGGTAAFDDLRQAVKNIEFLADPAAGELRIGNPMTSASSFVAAVIDRLSRRHPRIVFQLVAAGQDRLHRELSERNIDFVIARRGHPFTDDRFDYETLYDIPYVVVAGAQSPWARRRRIKLAELVNEPWVLPPPDNVVGLAATGAFRACGLDYPRATVVTDRGAERITLLTTGRFLTIVPASISKSPSRRPDLKVLPVELSMAPVPVGIVTVKNRTLSPVAKLFIECAREVAKPLMKKGR